MRKRLLPWLVIVPVVGFFIATAIVRIEARPRSAAARQAATDRAETISSSEISGTVISAKGPEAGVWVIAETTDMQTKVRKIVVTNDQGRYLIPELPNVSYKVWVRGYGLVDSKPVETKPGKTLALTAVVAPNARAAAQYYPANYWYSLVQVPPKSAFPIALNAPAAAIGDGEVVRGAGPASAARQIETQAAWIDRMKSGCEVCHQVGDKATREIPTALGPFKSGVEAWDRRLRSGQVGPGMISTLNGFGHDRGLSMFADWTDRIAAGEVPPAPPRPEGIERNLVLTVFDIAGPAAFLHDIVSTNKINPTGNSNGRIFASDWSAGMLQAVDPKEYTSSSIPIPLRDEADRKLLRRWTPQTMDYPSPYWGEEIVWDDPINPHTPAMDTKGRVWVNVQNHKPVNADYCKAGSDNAFAKIYPFATADGWGIDAYDPKTGRFELIDLCFRTHHTTIAGDKDETLYFSMPSATGGIGWLNTRVWDQTHDAEKAQGWCAPIIDFNGDGKIGVFTKPGEPPDPKLDRWMDGMSGYGVTTNPVDGSVWYAVPGPIPGKIVRISLGANPPATCMTEVYEPPFDSAKASGEMGYTPRGIDVDTDGVVWTALAGSGHLASFDRRRCKVLRGPTATGQHCPEGWSLYLAPGPKFKGETDAGVDWFYYNWVDRANTFGLGKNVSVVNGTGSDSLLVFLPDTKKWITLRVPYPLGFYTRGLEGRIDDSKGGWKGHGLWAANEERVIWHVEGGKGTKSQLVHFQIRPEPLAK